MRSAFLAIGLSMAAMLPAAAEPTVQDACNYFSRGIISGKGVVLKVFNNVDQPTFNLVTSELERYQTFVSQSILTPYGRERSDTSVSVVGYISARIVCSADIIDRRILTVSVLDGDQVGTQIENENGNPLNVIGVEPTAISVGTQVHQGKY